MIKKKKDFNVVIVDPERMSEKLTIAISEYLNNTVVKNEEA